VYCQRFSPYADLAFSDEEVICIYLWGVMDKRRELKTIYDDARRHLQAWYLRLPSYAGYVQRLNRVAGVFVPLLGALQDYLGLTPASEHDLTTFRHIVGELHGGELYLDKAYADELLEQATRADQALALLIPVKKAKGQKHLDAADQWWSTAVSRVRQPIESLFSWIEEKTGIPVVSVVYDGTEGEKNTVITPYLKFGGRKKEMHRQQTG